MSTPYFLIASVTTDAAISPGDKQVQLLGSGTILREVEKAAQMLADDWGVKSNIWSVTSFNELTREACSTPCRAAN
jgi:pyruvate dehydrogenase complex dehydrogenase (E1) component